MPDGGPSAAASAVPNGAPGGSPGASGGPSGAAPVSGFGEGAGAWLAGLGGLRNAVRQELVARQLDEQIAARFPLGRRLRVLDVGPGQGTQALRLARAGHLVTGLEPDPVMLETLRGALAAEPEGIRERVLLVAGDGRQAGRHFEPGSFDVVLCHGVLMYLPEPEADGLLAALARVLAPGGLLSLLVRNGDALAMRPALLGDWAAALDALAPSGLRTGSPSYTNRLGLPVRADTRADLERTLAGIAAPAAAWYGVRVFTDAAPDGEAPPADPESWARLLAAEEAAGRTDPYRSVAALLHLCGVRA